jgi:class 3 adenylate cyclase/tetratricopeptide (TPR) repeat protein
MAACTSCGKENEAGARFCSACGSALAVAPGREVRKTVTVLFCDVSGSTALGEQLDPEATRRLMSRYFESARAILERHGGTVEKFIGDAVMAVFGIPQVHEDDALRAVRAASELRDSVTEVRLRIGVNTGEVVTGTGETLVTGDAVNVAARLEQAAAPGSVLIGAQTYRLVRNAVETERVPPIEARGKSESVTAYALTRVETDVAYVRRLDAPLVGRERDLARVEAAFARVVRERSCHLFTILGAPGIGKSRLANEVTARFGSRALVACGHCLSYGEGITYWPLLQMLRDLGAESELAGLLDGAARPEETSRAVRRYLENLARKRPLVAVIDDVHWAEPTFLDLVEHVADLSRDAPIMLLCLARPDLLESRPGWSGGRHNATTLLLEPLSADEADTLISTFAGTDLDDAVRERIATAAAGNPLFVEQMLAMLDEDGGADMPIPPTIQALLAARLDRLEPTERELLERASVVGKEFWLRAVTALGADPRALPALARKELIQPHRSNVFPDDDAYRFQHELIRDAAYDALPKASRANLHEQVADWLGRELTEFDEIVGYHLEQAHGYHSELGEEMSDLAERAGRLLGAAGLRAEERADFPAAINLLSRAAGLLPSRDGERLRLLVHLGWVQHDAGVLVESDSLFAEAKELAAHEPALRSRANVGRLSVAVSRGADVAETRFGLERELATLERIGDHAALAETYRELAKAEAGVGRTEPADLLFDKAIANARLSGSARIEADVILWQLAMQCWGYLAAREGIRRTNTLLEQGVTGMAHAFALVIRGRYRGLQRDVAGGRADIEAGRALISEYGAEFYVAGSAQEYWAFEFEAGDYHAAEVCAREAFDRFHALGGYELSHGAAALVAHALIGQGRLAEAEEFARIAEEHATADDVTIEGDWRSVQAVVLSARGDHAAAEAMARHAVALAGETDYLELRAMSTRALAETLAASGQVEAATPWLDETIRLYERKESVFGVERTAARLRELARETLAELD